MEAISIRALAPQGGRETAEAERAFERLMGWMASKQACALPLHEVERREEEQIREVARLLLQEHINGRGQGVVGHGVKRVTGELLTEHRLRERGYVSIFGKVTIRRVAYGAEGVRSLMPLDEQLNLPQRSYSYELQKRVTRQAALGPFAAACATLTEWSGVSLPKRTVEALAVEAAQDVTQFYDHKTLAPDTPTSEVLICTADGKGVPLRRESPKERPRRDQKGPKPGEKKMATVAAVYTIAPYLRSPQEIVREVRRELSAEPAAAPRPHPEHKRVWASLKKDKDTMFDEMAAEMHKRDPRRQKTWAFLCDGEAALQKRAQAVLGAIGATLYVILDLFHVLEYLWKAASAFHPLGSPEAEQWVSQQLLALLQGRVSRVAASLRQSATKRGLRGQRRHAVDTAAHYFLKNKAFMRYHEYLALGLPIGSGAAEGACRHLIKDRLERTGMRWSVDGAEAVIQLRATELSGDWEEYWHYHIEAQRRRLYPEHAWQPAKTKPLLRKIS
jgi:hypothetical protein